MAGEFVPSGVELLAKNLGGFLSDLNKANNAIAELGVKSGFSPSIVPGLQGLGNVILDIGAKATAVAAGGIAALGAGLIAVSAKGTVMAADLEQGIANIAATSGKTVQQIAPLKGLIENLALDPKLKVTTDEATQAIQALTKQGLDMTAILDGAGKATVALSNATGGEFGTSASLTAGIMKAFNVDAKNLTTVIDGITGVTTNSKFTVDDYALAFAQAGAVAANLGVDLNDFNAVMASTASSFSSGSDAGTSFKTLLLRLSAPTAEMKAVMQEYGISLFDAEGKMRSMKDIVTQLNTVLQGNVTVTQTVGGATKQQVAEAERAQKAIPDLTHSIEQQTQKLDILKGELGLTIQYYGEGSPKARKLALEVQDLEYNLSQNQQTLVGYNTAIAKVSDSQAQQVTSTKQLTEAERARISEALGGADASRLILALSKTTGAEFETLSGKVNATGLAFNSAATRMDTTKGTLEIFQGILEAIQIQIGDKFIPIVKKIGIAMSEWASKNSTKFVAFFGILAKGVEDAIATVTDLFTTFQSGGLFGSRSGSFGSQGLLAALGLSPEAIVTVQDFFTQVGTLVSAFLEGGILGVKYGARGGRSTGLLSALGLSDESVQAIADAITTVKGFLLDLAPQFSDVSSVADVVGASILFVKDNFTAFAGALGGIVAAGVIGTVIAGIAAIASPIVLIITVAGLLGAAWATNFGGIQDKTYAVWATIQPILIGLGTWLATTIPVAIQAASTAWSTYLLPAITAISTFVTTYVMPALTELGSFLGTLLVADIAGFSAAFTIGMQVANSFAEAMTPVSTLLLSVGNLIGAVVSKTLQAFAGIWRNILLPAITAVGDYIGTTLQPIFGDTGTSVRDDLTPPFNYLTQTILPKFQTAMEAVGDVIKRVSDWFNALADAVKGFELPAVLQQHSPSPFEQSLIDIGIAAEHASQGMADMGQAGNITAAQLDKLLGVQRGLASTNNVIGAAADYVEKYFDKVAQTAGSKTKFALKVLKDVFKANAETILKAGDAAQQKAIFEHLAQNAVNWEEAGISGSMVTGAVATFVEFFKTEKDRLEKLQQEVFVKAGRTAVTLGNNLNDVIKASSDILDQRIETLQELVASGQAQVDFEGNVISATEAQDRLNQALREQQQVQEQLLVTQQNQAKLDFLDKQLNLLETINKAGLNAKDILGGLQLGLNASIPDIITATNRLVMAMVNQVDKDLQIGSPSKVMTKKGQFMGMGLVQGALDSIPAVTSAFQRLLSPLSSSQPVSPYGSNSTSNVINYNFGMNVSTGASANSVIMQYDVMRALVG